MTALTRQSSGTGWGRVVKWLDSDGNIHERAIPAPRFHESGNNIAQELAEEGLEIAPGQERALTAYLLKHQPVTRHRSVSHLGWADTTTGDLAYVLPTKVIGTSDEQLTYQAEKNSPSVSTMTSSGTLDEWKEKVASPCAMQPYLAFSLCVGLAGPLLKFAHMDSFGMHYAGRSSHGKTTSLQVAASEWGCGADPGDAPDQAYIRKWNSTANALEALAAAHVDGVLMLDELQTCTTKDFGNVVYNLLGGQGKSAMDSNRNLRKARSWRIVLFSTGEISGQQKIEEQ